MANSRWMDINQYSRWGGRSKKFAHYSTEEDDRQRIRYWEFAAYINPNEQYNVYRQTIKGWKLVAYVIGMKEFAAYINPNEQYNVYRQTIKGWKLVAYVIGMNVGKPKTPKCGKTQDANQQQHRFRPWP